MKSFLLFLTTVLAFIVNTAFAAVKFRVICAPNDYQGTGVTVYIDGNGLPMNQVDGILYEIDYEGIPNQYYYGITGTKENELSSFGNPRTWDKDSTTTLIEIYGRRYTTGDSLLQTLPRLYPPLEGYDKYSLLFQEGEVPVINIQMNSTSYNKLITSKDKEAEYVVEFDFYTPYEKRHFTNVTLSLSGQGSKNQEKKPYKIDLSGNEADKNNSEIYNRKEFKLRSLRYDETYIKNKLAADIAESLGLPITQSSPCRLYINNKSYGLYELSDMYKKKFVKRFFKPEKIGDKVNFGSLYKGVSSELYPAYLYRDFEGNTVEDLYENIVPSSTNQNINQDILNMIEWAENLPETASLAEIEKQFDVDMFLKYMAIEYLICHWDGYLGNGNNFFVYIEPNNGKYHLFSYDFDLTFGKWCKSSEGSFDEYVTNIKPKATYGNGPKRLPLLYKKILKNPEVHQKMNELIKDIVGNLFNTEALVPRIQYFYEFLRDDMVWDVFCYNFIETQFFVTDHQTVPTIKKIQQQFVLEGSTEDDFLNYLNRRIPTAAKIYNVTTFKSDARYGTVGGKLMTMGKDKDNEEGEEGEKLTATNNNTSSGAISNINNSVVLLITVLSLLLVNLIF